jgi:endonuclease/exonuclease/phosphatase family metal-dependent hydrolase
MTIWFVAAWLYLGTLIGYVLWVRLDLYRPWWFIAAAPFAFWLFAGGLIFPLIATVTGMGLLRGAPLLASVAVFWGQFVGSRQRVRSVKSEDPRLRVMTANLLDTNRRLAEMVEAIRQESPDLLALQEVHPTQVRALREALSASYPYEWFLPGPQMPTPGQSEGMGILSRHPFQRLDVVQPDTAPGVMGLVPNASNPTQVFTLHMDGRTIDVVHMHPRIPVPRFCRVLGLPFPCGLDNSARERDVQAIIARAKTLSDDAILLGDMNATDQCREYRLLAREWRDAFRAVGRGLGMTFPVGVRFFGLHSPWPLFRIDYVLLRGALYPITARTGAMPGSDHRYVVADISWPHK